VKGGSDPSDTDEGWRDRRRGLRRARRWHRWSIARNRASGGALARPRRRWSPRRPNGSSTRSPGADHQLEAQLVRLAVLEAAVADGRDVAPDVAQVQAPRVHLVLVAAVVRELPAAVAARRHWQARRFEGVWSLALPMIASRVATSAPSRTVSRSKPSAWAMSSMRAASLCSRRSAEATASSRRATSASCLAREAAMEVRRRSSRPRRVSAVDRVTYTSSRGVALGCQWSRLPAALAAGAGTRRGHGERTRGPIRQATWSA
jgi:hypothetical protein